MKKMAAGIVLFLFGLGLMLVGLTGFSHGAIATKRGNSLGVVTYQTNPFTYLEGVVTDVAIVDNAVNLRFQPRGTYGLFTQEVLLCDTKSVIEKFHGKGNVVVVTYETRAHRTVQGIGCHDLAVVDSVGGQQ